MLIPPPWAADVPAEHATSAAPLHVEYPPLRPLSWEEADNVVARASTHVQLVFLVASAPYRHTEVAELLSQAADPETPKQRPVDPDDVAVLTRAEFLLPSDVPLGHTTVINFADEVKPAGPRRRTITWPKNQNEVERLIARDIPYKRLFFHPGKIRENSRFPFAALADFKKFFQQFPFLTRNWWPILVGGRSYTLRTIPTGSAFSPILAQALLCAIAEDAVRDLPSVTFDAMIDNVRFVAHDMGELRQAWGKFQATCATIGITMGDTTDPTRRAYDHLGIHVTSKRDVVLTTKTATKMVDAADRITWSGCGEWRDIQSAFGRLVYALTTVGVPLDKAYYVLKFMRRRCRARLEPRELTTVWMRARVDWRHLVAEAITSRYVFGDPPLRRCALYTDASEDGWGVVVFGLFASYTVFGDRWTHAERDNRIDRLEFQALKIGLRWIARAKGPEPIAVDAFVDNTTTLFVMQKGFSPKYTLNEAAAACRGICEQHDITLLGPSWVPTKFNVADHPSRIFDRRDALDAVRRQVQGN